MRALVLLLALALAGCGGLDRDGVVLMLDDAYRAEVLLSNDDGIASPDGLLWADGRLYIADEGGSAVRVWAPGQGVRTIADAGAGLRSPEDLVRGADGALFVTDDDAGGVWRIGTDGAVTHLAPQVASSEGLAAAPGGALLVGDQEGRRIVAVAPDGAVRPFLAGGIAKPEGMAFANGGLYVADNRERILYLIRGGRLHRPLRNRPRFSPESILSAGGALLITDSENGKLHRYTPEDGLETIAVFGGSLANVQGIAADEAGNLYVSVQSDLGAGRGYVLRLARRR